MEPNIELSKTRDFGEIIADSFLFVKQNIKPLLSCFFVFCGFFLLVGLVTVIIQQIRISELVDSVGRNTYNTEMATNPFRTVFGLDTILAMLFSLLGYVAMPVAIMSFMTLYKQNGNVAPTNAEVWVYFKYYFFRVLGSSIINFFLIVLGMMFCLIPGLYLLPALSLIIPIMIVENTGYSYAFSQAFRLIKGSWWTIFGAIFVIYIIIIIVGSIVNIPFSAVNMWSMFVKHIRYAHLSTTSIILGSIVRELAQVFHILLIITIMICYYSLNEEKESTGLMDRIDQLGTDHADTNAPAEEY